MPLFCIVKGLRWSDPLHVHDYMLKKYGKKPGYIELIGYDYAQEMIHLANLFQENLPDEYNFDGYFEIDKIRNMLKSRDLSVIASSH